MCPFTKLDDGEARNTAAPTSSSTLPQRPAGVRLASHAVNICPELKSLRLVRAELIGKEFFFAALTTRAPNLRALELHDCSISSQYWSLGFLVRLEKLSVITKREGVESRALYFMAAHCVSLKSLTVSFDERVWKNTDQAMAHFLARRGQQLTHLSLSHPPHPA